MSARSVEERLEQLEVRADIGDLVTRYCIAVDDRDIEGVADLFTEDGSFGHQSDPGVVGREAIREHYTERLSGLVYSYHFAHNNIVDFSGGDEATGVVNAHAEMGFEGALTIAALRYHDTYRRVDGMWRFARRRLSFFYFLPAADLVAGDYATLRKRWPAPAIEADLPESLDTYRAFVGAE